MKLVVVTLLMSLTALAFEPIYKEAQSYSNKVSNQFSNMNNPRFCRVETSFIEEKNAIKISAGVVGSPVDYFGWNALIDIKDFPLKEGYRKVFKEPGVTGMVLSYDGNALKFEVLEGEQVWNRLYPFEIQIDSKLLKPKYFVGVMKGFERGPFGLKKHVRQKCKF